MIYLDNAATVYPKPKEILQHMVDLYAKYGVSPGRGSYDMAIEAEDLVNEVRKKVAQFFCAPEPERVIFTNNATDALNILIQGMVRPNDHVVSTMLEHNSVLRPLHHLSIKGVITYDLLPFDENGFVRPDDVVSAIRSNTRMVILSHASNVLGTVQPVFEIAQRCAEYNIPVFIDAAQSAGVVPIDMKGWGIGGMAFTGHKSMLGPTGIGGLVLNKDIEIEPTRFGGTGINSKSLIHTGTYPHRLEAGTINMLGIIGLSLGIDFINKEGMDSIYDKEMALFSRLKKGLAAISGLKIYCSDEVQDTIGVLTVNVEGVDPEDVGAILDADFGIAVRTGLHCAPMAHQGIGTYPQGAVRFSIGPFNTASDIDQAIEAMRRIAKG